MACLLSRYCAMPQQEPPGAPPLSLKVTLKVDNLLRLDGPFLFLSPLRLHFHTVLKVFNQKKRREKCNCAESSGQKPCNLCID